MFLKQHLFKKETWLYLFKAMISYTKILLLDFSLIKPIFKHVFISLLLWAFFTFNCSEMLLHLRSWIYTPLVIVLICSILINTLHVYFTVKTATSDGDPFEDIKKILPKKVVHTIIFLVLALLGRTFLLNLIYNWSIIQGNLILISLY